MHDSEEVGSVFLKDINKPILIGVRHLIMMTMMMLVSQMNYSIEIWLFNAKMGVGLVTHSPIIMSQLG